MKASYLIDLLYLILAAVTVFAAVLLLLIYLAYFGVIETSSLNCLAPAINWVFSLVYSTLPG
jgi:uncharacterized RDD family membrane protein YckC